MTLVGFSGRANVVGGRFFPYRELEQLIDGMPGALRWYVLRGSFCPGMLFTSPAVRRDHTGKVSEQLRYRAASIYDFSDLFLVLGADDPVDAAGRLSPINMIEERHRLGLLSLDNPPGSIGTLTADGQRRFQGIDLDVIPRYPSDIIVLSDTETNARRRNLELERVFSVLSDLGVDPSQVRDVRGLEGISATDIRQRYRDAHPRMFDWHRSVQARVLSAEDQSIVDEFRRRYDISPDAPVEINEGPLRGRFPGGIPQTSSVKTNATTEITPSPPEPVSTIHRALRRIQMNTNPKEGNT